MSTLYPTDIDTSTSLPYPTATDDTNSPSLSGGQDNQNDALIAIETLVGTNATQTAPVSGTFLTSASDGTSIWANTVPTGTVVGTSDTQTLTNKTIDASNNTISNLSGSDIANLSITATQIANATITLANMAAGALTQPNGSEFTIGTMRVQFATTTVDIAATGTSYNWSVSWPTTFSTVVYGFQSVLGGNSLARTGNGTFESLSKTGMAGFVESSSGTETVTIYCMAIGT